MAAEGGRAAARARADGGERVFARAERDYVRRGYMRKVELVRRVCRRIEGGANVAEICRDPDMPQRSTLMSWLAADDALRGLVAEAQARAAEVFTPRRAYHYWDEAVAAEFLARIEDGRGLAEVCAEPDMPVHQTITRWLRERPAFREAYRLAREAQADRLFDLAWRIACEAGEDTVKTARLKIQTIKWRIGRLTPKVYGPQRAAAPEPAPPEKTHVVFTVRQFEIAPGRRMVEVTHHIAGRHPQDVEAFRAAIREGRLAHDALDSWVWPEPEG